MERPIAAFGLFRLLTTRPSRRQRRKRPTASLAQSPVVMLNAVGLTGLRSLSAIEATSISKRHAIELALRTSIVSAALTLF